MRLHEVPTHTFGMIQPCIAGSFKINQSDFLRDIIIVGKGKCSLALEAYRISLNARVRFDPIYIYILNPLKLIGPYFMEIR